MKRINWTAEMDEMIKDTHVTSEQITEKYGVSKSSVTKRRSELDVKVACGRKAPAAKTPKISKSVKPAKSVKTAKSVGSRIKALRVAKGLTQEDLAKEIGYNFKYANTAISDFERDVYKPSEERLALLAKALDTTVDYILTGEEVKEEDTPEVTEIIVEPKVKEKVKAALNIVKSDPQPVKSALTNSEGYIDSTAHKAIAIVMNVNNSVPDVKPGEVYSSDFRQDDVLILQIIGQRALVTYIYDSSRNEDKYYQCPIHVGDDNRFINLSKIFTKKLTDLGKKKGEIDSKTSKFIKTRMLRYLSGPVEAAINEGNKEDLDEASKLFIDSVSYFNAKNGTEVKVPEKNISLKDAIDISNSMGIELKEFLRDHSNDRKLDRLVQLEEEAKRIREELGL